MSCRSDCGKHATKENASLSFSVARALWPLSGSVPEYEFGNSGLRQTCSQRKNGDFLLQFGGRKRSGAFDTVCRCPFLGTARRSHELAIRYRTTCIIAHEPLGKETPHKQGSRPASSVQRPVYVPTRSSSQNIYHMWAVLVQSASHLCG